ncbi:MAG: hypothetical protein HFJ37_03870 [Clostridia bacterium]|nr:hypothetical protein [Clostridia bacterium]
MKKEVILFIFIAILIVFISFLLTKAIMNNTNVKETSSSSSKIKEEKKQIPKENIIPDGKVGIVSHKYTGYGRIEVVVKNNTGRELKYVEIIVHCWDKNGNNLGDKKTMENNMNTKDNYKKAIYCGSDMYKYELEIKY